jgi:ABC-type amino acid transport substrate-binding protein
MRQIQIDGQVRVAVRPDRPQALSPGGTLDGFDVRVAEEVATRLGVDAARSTLTVQEMLGPTPAWQLALPSQSLPRGRADEYIASTPYYFWPHYIVVASASPASSIADLADETVCAAQGSAGQSWLSEMESLVPRVLADESACEASVRSGESQAFVSERRLLPDFASDGAFRALSEQPVLLEPRAMLVPRSLPGAREFVAEIDLLIEEMRADGTISELSRTWFGGQDLAR